MVVPFCFADMWIIDVSVNPGESKGAVKNGYSFCTQKTPLKKFTAKTAKNAKKIQKRLNIS